MHKNEASICTQQYMILSSSYEISGINVLVLSRGKLQEKIYSIIGFKLLIKYQNLLLVNSVVSNPVKEEENRILYKYINRKVFNQHLNFTFHFIEYDIYPLPHNQKTEKR